MIDAKTIFNAESKPPIELFAQNGVGLYIPSYQRPYSWDKEKVVRLLEDISFGFSNLNNFNDSFTFLGTVITIHDTNNATIQPVVIADTPAKILTVIDGQQRMTSLLLVCTALHNKIKLLQRKLSSTIDLKPENESGMPSLEWVNSLAQGVLGNLKKTFCDEYDYGDLQFYPRMIRSIDDQWARTKKFVKYESPIAKLVSEYISDYMNAANEYMPSKRSEPIEGEEALVERFKQMMKYFDEISKNKSEDIPLLDTILNAKNYTELFPQPVPLDDIKNLNETELAIFTPLAILVYYARYILYRVVLTVVTGKNEDYAFSIFESLNTTGEPLTAFETFKPRVINSVGLAEYEHSDEKTYMDQITHYFSEFKVGNELQKETKDFLIYFFGTYAGEKASGRLSEQRNLLKKLFEEDESKAIQFIQTMSYLSIFMKDVWNETAHDYKKFSSLIEHSLSPSAMMGLAYLKELKHTIVIPVLALFFIQILEAPSAEDKIERVDDFEDAIRAIVAFTTLWRATRNSNGTGGIDNEYRELLSKIDMPSGLLPIAKKFMNKDIIDITLFKKELESRLCDNSRKGKISNKEDFIKKAKNIPIYDKGKKIAKILLLAAHHDAIESPMHIGLLTKSRAGYNSCLTLDSYLDEDNLSLEHVAPQTNNDGLWDSQLYNNATLIDMLGNLTLVSHSLNASLGNRKWAEKKIFYQVVGAKTADNAAEILKRSAQEGISFADSTKELLDSQKYMPNLISIANVQEWTPDFIDARNENLYGLAWDQLIQWIR